MNDDVPLGLKAEPKGHGYPVVRVTAVDLLVRGRGDLLEHVNHAVVRRVAVLDVVKGENRPGG